ncbi:hypothetical protein GCK72_020111 [Caenorhabditis remanei]|uniref:Uncharacterized protein n=1 Tax=Caenorhabditis remanei TaxID=31234 RepID=A0A6A5GFM1_CAERE|nr:hypothetical protein GCK72_020111 [Caenorhabditis remanei]KAF1753554.1 hypothetical protein GCK72_020111 [Caenorhabditis remanei]
MTEELLQISLVRQDEHSGVTSQTSYQQDKWRTIQKIFQVITTLPPADEEGQREAPRRHSTSSGSTNIQVNGDLTNSAKRSDPCKDNRMTSKDFDKRIQ